MTDFEKAFKLSLKNFPKAIIKGCFFNYIKCHWQKEKLIGLARKNTLKKLIKSDEKYNTFKK